MKFTDGNWMMRKGRRGHYPAEAYDIDIQSDALTVYAPAHAIRHRGDTLGGPLLTVRLSSPMPDVIGVNISRFSGANDLGPNFPLSATTHDAIETHVDDSVATLKSGQLTARLSKKNWALDFVVGDHTVTKSESKGMGLFEVEGDPTEDGTYTMGQLSLQVGEFVYGLGERFTSFTKNGQVVETWNKDGGTGSEQAYKSVPFYLTNKGYGVFVNHSGNVSFEVATEKVSRVQFSVPGESLEYFVIYGPTPKEILDKYTALTGRPALPAAWSFGLWLTTSFTTSYDEDTVTSFIQGMADRDVPLHVFHFDCFWMKEFHWCDFQWDERVFPDPPGMLKRLKDRGLNICVWINPYIAQRSRLFEEGKRNGYLIKKPNGDVWQTDQWQPGMGIVDFTNPDACRWFGDQLRALVAMGVDSFKTDFGERIPTDVAYFDGSDPERMHNFYTHLYNKTVFDVLEETRGVGEAVLFARSATAGGQQFPVHWGGDCNSNFESMAESLRGGLSLGLSGFGFWSHDIGGFEGTPPIELYKRWVAFGLLSSHSRLHGSSSYRVPWVYDETAVDVLRHFTKLKCRLMPYLFAKAVEAKDHGTPVMRAMLLEFPDDPTSAYLDRQYMLGDSLLVAPVFSADNAVEYYVPEGRWTNFLSGDVVVGPKWARETHDFQSLPLLVRPNSIVAVGNNDTRPDYAFADGVTLQVYELEDGHTASTTVTTVRGDVAMTATVKRHGRRVMVNVQGDTQSWQLLLVGGNEIDSVEGGAFESAEHGVLVKPLSGSTELIITERA